MNYVNIMCRLPHFVYQKKKKPEQKGKQFALEIKFGHHFSFDFL